MDYNDNKTIRFLPDNQLKDWYTLSGGIREGCGEKKILHENKSLTDHRGKT